MKEIQLTQGKVALVDDEDYDKLMEYKWCANKIGNTFYAVSRIKIDGRWATLYMHKFIIGDHLSKTMVDHRDGNGLNNQRYNLRPASKSENAINSVKRKNCSSKYRGVYRDEERQKWQSYIKINGKRKHLGRFDIEEDAAIAHDVAAIKRDSEFRRLNFPI